MRRRYHTPEQLDQLEQRRQAIGENAIPDVEREWAQIFATLRTEMEAGMVDAEVMAYYGRVQAAM